MIDLARSFYLERVPAQFNRAARADAAGVDDGSGSEQPAHRPAVDATLRVCVGDESGGAAQTFHLNIRDGRMHAEETPDAEPFLTLAHDRASLETLARESGDSVLGFLAALAGLPGELQLTWERVRALREIDASMRFALLADPGFTLVAHFGRAERGGDPQCSVRIDEPTYRALRAGQLDAEEAFLSGRVEVEGDMQVAFRLALALLGDG